jgi:hypothetical protein
MEGKGAVQEIRSCFSNTSIGFNGRIWLQGNGERGNNNKVLTTLSNLVWGDVGFEAT